MIKGVNLVKNERVYHGDDYYLIAASIVRSEDAETYHVTVMLNGHTDMGAETLGSLEEMLECFERTKKKYEGKSKG